MDLLSFFADLLAHFDSHLQQWCTSYGWWAIGLLALIVFAETGTVVLPFLPGDSMLFVVGFFCAAGQLPFGLVAPCLISAALLGDLTNYLVGRSLGERLMGRWPWVWRGHARAHAHFARHGSRTLLIARFVPVLRSFAPFAAGFSAMRLRRFLGLSLLAAMVWVLSLMSLGAVLGSQPWFRDHLSRTILIIIGLSLLPTCWTLLRRETPSPAVRPPFSG